jgi:hypothetical protein
VASLEEPLGFAAWVGRHCRLARVEVPRAGTARRLLLARVFAGLTEAGVSVSARARGFENGPPEKALAAVWGDWLAEQIRR